MLLVKTSDNLATSRNPTMTEGGLTTVRKIHILAFLIHIFKVALYCIYLVDINEFTATRYLICHNH